MNNNNDSNNNTPLTINVLEEKLYLDKKFVEKATVQITRKVVEENETASIDLLNEDIEITKVAINKYVAVTPSVRYEGNVIIIPVVKEVVITEKKLLLVEEVHITKHITTREHHETVTLKKQEVIINHVPSSKNTGL